jgi:hypothetical protein
LRPSVDHTEAGNDPVLDFFPRAFVPLSRGFLGRDALMEQVS